MTEVFENGEDSWQLFRRQIQESGVSEYVNNWFSSVQCSGLDESSITLDVRDEFARDWIVEHYLDLIQKSLTTSLGFSPEIKWVINRSVFENQNEKSENTPNTENNLPLPTQILSASTAPIREDARKKLNPRYIFENYVKGPSNELALAAAQAVADRPAQAFNPLFLFGGTGLGKTHLLSAIGHQILQTKKDARIIYVSSEQFVNEVVNAVRFSKLEEFHAKYRNNCDVMLMDDIQLLAGKDRTQAEFFHIFNTLYDSQRQIVVASDRLPHEIPDIEDRLRSRFQWGLIADIQPPEVETRVAILQQKAANESVILAEDVAFFLANNIRSNIRELEGALVRLLAHASLTHTPLSVAYAENILGDILSARPNQISVDTIQKTVAGFYRIKISDLNSRSRQKNIARPRQVAMYLARKHAGESFPELGRHFGGKDHTTVMSACRKVDSLLKADSGLRKEVFDLERQLNIAAG